MKPEYVATARSVASRYARPPEFPLEDMLQEALVAIWKATESKGPLTETQAYGVARDRCLRVLGSERFLGSERPKGRPEGGNGVKPVKVFLTDDGNLPERAAFEEDLTDRLVVRQAVAALEPVERETVYAIYWEGWSWRQAKSILGVVPQAHWDSARNKLRADLVDLRGGDRDGRPAVRPAKDQPGADGTRAATDGGSEAPG